MAESLIASSELPLEALTSAAAFADQTADFLGDRLLLSGVVSPNDWAAAARIAQESAPVLP